MNKSLYNKSGIKSEVRLIQDGFVNKHLGYSAIRDVKVLHSTIGHE